MVCSSHGATDKAVSSSRWKRLVEEGKNERLLDGLACEWGDGSKVSFCARKHV